MAGKQISREMSARRRRRLGIFVALVVALCAGTLCARIWLQSEYFIFDLRQTGGTGIDVYSSSSRGAGNPVYIVTRNHKDFFLFIPGLPYTETVNKPGHDWGRWLLFDRSEFEGVEADVIWSGVPQNTRLPDGTWVVWLVDQKSRARIRIRV